MVHLTRGIQTFWRRRYVWLALHLTKVCLTLLFTIPILLTVNSRLGYSTFAQPLLENWSLDVIMELIGTSDNVLSVFLSVLVCYLVPLFLVKQLLNGGVYWAMLQREDITARAFAAECLRGFRGNLKISLLMLIVYLPAMILVVMIVSVIPESIGASFGPAAWLPLFLRMAVTWFVLIVASIFSELLRLRHCTDPDEPLKDAAGFVFGHYLRRLVKYNALYHVWFIPFVVVWAAVELSAGGITAAIAGGLGVLAELVLFQLCSLARTGQSLLGTATIAGAFATASPGRFAATPKESAGD